jgi:hypothetical protein
MARTLGKTFRMSSFAALGLVAAVSLASVAPASAATADNGRSHHPARFGGQLFIFKGTVAAVPTTSTTALQVTVTGGNRPALKALVGNTSSPLAFTVDGKTSYIAWTASTRGNAPSATTADALKVGDPVHLRIRAHYGTPLAGLLVEPTRMVNDFVAAQKVAGRMFVFHGPALSVDATAMTITVDVRRGNWNALNALLGQPSTETFHYDAATQFLSWNKRAPHAFDPATIKVGDPITVRTRAVWNTPLANLLAAPLWKVNDHEPVASINGDGGNMTLGG